MTGTHYLTDLVGDLGFTESLSGLFLELFLGPNALPQHLALIYGGSINGTRSDTIKVPLVQAQGNPFTATAEGTDLSDSDLSTDKATVVVARTGIAYQLGDLWRTADGGDIATKIAQGLFSGYTRSQLIQLCNLIDGFSKTQTATSKLTAEDVLKAKAQLGAVPGPRLGILHSKQFGELEADIGLNLGGAHAFSPASQELIQKVGSGYVGQWAGIDWFVTDDVVTGGGDYKGAIMAPGAIAWADGTPEHSGLPTQMLVGGKVLVEEERQAGKFRSRLIANALTGMSLGVTTRGVTLNSDVA